MKGKRLLGMALALIMALGAFTGCAENNLDEEVVAVVGDTPIYKWYYQAHLTKQLALYKTYYGKDLTQPEYKSELKEYKENRLTDLVGEFALRDLAKKKGLYDLTAEQEAQIDQNYLDFYNQNMQGFLTQYGSDDEGRRKAEQAYVDWLASSSLTPERVRETMVDEIVLEQLYKELAANPEITEEALRAYYDEQLNTQKTEVEKDIKWLGTNKPDPILFAPEGYVETVRLALDFTQKQVESLQLTANTVSATTSAYHSELGSRGPDAPATKLKQEAMETALKAFNETLARCYQERAADMQPILEELRGGADFIETMQKKSEDDHLINYYVCAESDHVEESYREAALKLENPGDISDVVELEEGICIIQLVEKIQPGAQAYEDVKEQLRVNMLSNQRLNMTFQLKEEYAKKAMEDNIVQLYLDKL